MARKPVRILVDLLNQNWPVRKAKAFRNALVERSFRAHGVGQGLEFAEQLRRTGSQRFCFSIAFNTPWVIDALTRAWPLHCPGMTLVIIDNSSRKSARPIIEGICRARGIAYFALPGNWEMNPNRSHGIAMNWVAHNIVCHLRPELFGFLDHDCFPTSVVDIPKLMEGKAVYGARRIAKRGLEGWFLWAGFCFFRFSAMDGVDLDFTPRFESGMDTGGGNWAVLYRSLDPNNVAYAETTAITLTLGGTEAIHGMPGGVFFHVGGASYRRLISTAHYRRLMSDYVWETWLGGPEGRLVNDL